MAGSAVDIAIDRSKVVYNDVMPRSPLMLSVAGTMVCNGTPVLDL